MTEPTYTYVRGAGWIPSEHGYETGSRIVGPYLVVLEKRLPNMGEGFWICGDNETVQQTLDAVENEYNEYPGEIGYATWDAKWASAQWVNQTVVVKISNV